MRSYIGPTVSDKKREICMTFQREKRKEKRKSSRDEPTLHNQTQYGQVTSYVAPLPNISPALLLAFPQLTHPGQNVSNRICLTSHLLPYTPQKIEFPVFRHYPRGLFFPFYLLSRKPGAGVRLYYIVIR